MPGENMDIIDKAMANDDFDYGDKAPVSNNADTSDGGDEQQQVQQPVGEKPADQQTLTPEQSIKGKEEVPGRVPTVKPGDQQQQPQLKRVGAQFADGKGNIVDKDGKILARAGEAARLWQEASRATAQVTNLTRQLERATQENTQNRELIARAKEIAELPAKLGVSREDYNEGITLMSRWRADPVGVAREIVARTLTFGHNVSDILGKTAGDALEMKAITSLVKQTTQPIEEARIATQKQQEANVAAERAYNDFVSTHEFAEVHADVIAKQMAKGIRPEMAYLQIENFALANGLDFSQPLGPQIVARQQAGNVQRPTGQPQQRPLPNGGRDSGNGTLQTEPSQAAATDTWDSILRGAMHE